MFDLYAQWELSSLTPIIISEHEHIGWKFEKDKEKRINIWCRQNKIIG